MCILVLSIFLISLASVSAQEYSLDVSIAKTNYSSGENVSYKVILLKDGIPFQDKVIVVISDAKDINVLNFVVDSNKENKVLIEKNFSSGLWKIEANYSLKNVKRFFLIGDREGAVFSIDSDKLIIRNTGNIPYSKTVQILIGDKVITQKQDIDIGKFKEIKLVAPDGNYDVQVFVGGASVLPIQNVHLSGTGQVVGALDEDLVDSPPVIGGPRDVNSDSFFSTRNFPIAFIFIAAVFGLFVLITIEKGIRKRRSSTAKDMVSMHK